MKPLGNPGPQAFGKLSLPGPWAFTTSNLPGPRAFGQEIFVDPRDARGMVRVGIERDIRQAKFYTEKHAMTLKL